MDARRYQSWLGLGLLAFASATRAGEADNLRAAIQDLSSTFGGAYPKSAEFQTRLDRLEPALRQPNAPAAKKAREEFSELQREALIANPLVSGQPILFVARRQYAKGHHNTETFFPNTEHEFNNGRFAPGGSLKLLNLAKGGVRTLLDLPAGVARDPEVHFDGRRILFSMRRNADDSYHLYEIAIDGSGLRQLTFASNVDDLDPLYLPDGSIVFSSTREPKYCGCNRHIMANLYRMEAYGANIRQIGKSALFEGHGSLMPDGRILYDRWEYVDRNFGDAQGLWTVNPDGTTHAVFWGNNTGSPGAVLDARVIPGTETVLCTFSSCHDRPWGALAIVDPQLGLDGPAAVTRIWPADAIKRVNVRGHFDDFKKVSPKYEDPWPLSDKYFLCSRMTGQGDEMGIYLLDVFGNELLLHAENTAALAPARPKRKGGPAAEGWLGCFDPMPLAPRPRPNQLPDRLKLADQEGRFYVHDVYSGTHMEGVKRGEVKALRVVEAPEKRFWTNPQWGGQGRQSPAMNWHNFENKRILGTVPVEADGSAYFAVPADAFIYFQLLDKDGMMIQSMRSGTIVQPGETAGCVGCHEDRRQAPPALPRLSLAVQRPPSRMDGWHGAPRLFNYLAEVQPIFDRHCLECHDFGGLAADTLILAGDRGLTFNASYNELWRKGHIRAVGAGPAETQPARSWGSHASRLVATDSKCPGKGRLKGTERERVITWIDLNAPYYPSYASAHPENLAGRSPLNDAQLARLEKLTGVPFRQLADHRKNRGPQISFDRPELSPCLAVFQDEKDPRRAEALAIIREGQADLARNPESDAKGFQPCDLDQWREAKYAERRQRELANREAIRQGRRFYDKR